MSKVTIPEIVKIIVPEKLPQNITILEMSVFQKCTNLTSIDIPEKVIEISSAFVDCEKLASVSIPTSVTTLRQSFMSCTNLTSIELPEKVEYIGEFTFLMCNNLESINIPQSVKYIDRTAFAFCEKLKSIKIETSYSVVEELLSEIPDGATIIVPESDFEKYVSSCGTRLKINDREPIKESQGNDSETDVDQGEPGQPGPDQPEPYE